MTTISEENGGGYTKDEWEEYAGTNSTVPQPSDILQVYVLYASGAVTDAVLSLWLQELAEYTEKNVARHHMMVGPWQGSVLAFLLGSIRAKNVLEV